jgi:two-component system, LytTR family, response regulator
LLKLSAGTERFVFLDEIRLVTSSENYTGVVVGLAGERLLVRRTLQAWEETLPAAKFVRVHRRTIINLAHIRALQRSTESVFLLTLDGVAAPVHVSLRYLPLLRGKLPERPDDLPLPPTAR